MRLILGSRSPRRRELLAGLVEDDGLTILPPLCSDELSFAGLHQREAITEQLHQIVRHKSDDVCRQIASHHESAEVVVVCADTIVVAQAAEGSKAEATESEAGRLVVLGQPDADDLHNQVRRWFTEFYSGRTHEVWTCFRICRGSQVVEQTVRTSVIFHPLSDDLIDWYLGTGESAGKAGGYGIQGHAAMFVKSLDGSLTNVIGLPMFELCQALQQMGLALRSGTEPTGEES
jgi:septum formation protein